MLAVARTFALAGVEALPVAAEADIHSGLPAFNVVGLPDAAVRESRERVRAAINNSGGKFPQQRITVSLAPSDLRKAGPGFDLAIAAAILAASSQLEPSMLDRWALAGELGLDGAVRPVRGALAMAEAARRDGAEGIVVASENAAEAALVPDLRVAPVRTVADLARVAAGDTDIPEIEPGEPARPREELDLAQLRGQPFLREALEVAAAGAHGMLIVGPPGAGKSMAARRLPSLLPALDHSEAIEVRRIAGVAGLPQRDGVIAERPFRAPHHTISTAGLVGGGNPIRPGEITLAHRGVLFLDELPEFTRGVLEALREPLESGAVTIARAARKVSFPARFQLIAAANPCPCGHGAADPRCQCRPEQVTRYGARLSGALADRIDIQLSVRQPSGEALADGKEEGSAPVRGRVAAARAVQRERYGQGGITNATAADDVLRRRAELEADALRALGRAQQVRGLSGRGWTRVLRLARTCADLDGETSVGERHVEMALALRGRSGS